MTAEAPSISWRDLLALFSPAGRQQIERFIEQAKRERGSGWIESLKTDFPMFCWIAEIVCTRDAEQAFAEIQFHYSSYPLGIIKNQFLSMHAWLKAEIDKPRG